MNYSQNTGSTNTTKELLCSWVPKYLFDYLRNSAKESGTTYSDVLINILKGVYEDN